jgi:hypothetical protein
VARSTWAGPKTEFPTLGYQVADWIESRCAIPDREFAGQPFLLTDEQLGFLLEFYRLHPKTGRFHYERGAQLTRPHKWGKGPFGAAIICAEAQGPVRFAGWADEYDPDRGEFGVRGKQVPTPWIQVTAVSEDQTANVYSALLPMIELGALHGEIEDTGLGRINLPGGGKIEPVTAAAISRLGQRVTFALQDQTESWLKSNGGRKLADNQRRGIASFGGRWLSTPNAYDPTEESVSQYTAEHEREGVYHDDVEPPSGLSIGNKRDRRKALRIVYGHAVTGERNGVTGEASGIKGWIDLERIDAEIRALLGRDPQQAERWFLNRKEADAAKAWDPERIDRLAITATMPKRSLITLGVDGARFSDALAIVGTDVASGFQWPVGIWERPEGAPEDYEHPLDEVDGAMEDAFAHFDVWRVYIDPQYIDALVNVWQGRWGEKRVLPWRTNRPRQMAWAVRGFTDGIKAGEWSFNGDPEFARHLKNAVRQKVNVYDDKHRQMYIVSKDRPDSTRKIDAAPAAILSWEARGDAIRADAKPRGTRAKGWN